ncbi:hypothetical protein HN51_032901 [Arachis hypogaea]|uniref:Uncharacterized protein n=1 Tax=Arachis hypogaea TaxID=3818 RepID=A0A445B2S7_ARAHY|nr:uncharacterized protein LOC112716503 [Arachis hypogaea]QHO17293.1 uncharacterized protein DS421_10g310930 [Arachis hypogaea]RYR32984.1 hypothetical protein Ahy_A10g047513 [Arachis hypogaea]
MENMLKTPPKVPIQAKPLQPEPQPDCKTPTTPLSSFNQLRKPVTPDRLRVPKAFKYPERYTSPTDLMVSPVTKGLLARTKRGGALLPPPSKTETKIPDTSLQDVSPLQNKVPMLIEEKLK